MKIMIYCQHVLGMGHFFRTMEIANALKGHTVILITGGRKLPARLPDTVCQFKLPGLMMDPGFSSIYPAAPDMSLDRVKALRQEKLMALVKKECPDVFLVELFPFGRKAFEFELIPVLKTLKGRCRILCSLRDILVEKKNAQAYEDRVIHTLNQYFCGLLVHSDPGIIPLNLSFSGVDRIRVPLVYTGFISPIPNPAAAEKFRTRLGTDKPLVVASAGSGSVGEELLISAARAAAKFRDRFRMALVTGPYMSRSARKALAAMAGPDLRVYRFCRDFVSLLGAADLSVSMGGYNTLMNSLAAQIPCLALPFDQNREQGLRILSLSGCTGIRPLPRSDLSPDALGLKIKTALGRDASHGIDLSGAVTSAGIIQGKQ